jgi:3-methyladenine DNA glycosylase/8-oxoguanine DNA glycosylase
VTGVALEQAEPTTSSSSYRYRPASPVDIGLTLGPLAHGRGDPTIRLAEGIVWRATRTPLGPATLELQRSGSEILARSWGPGAEAALIGLPELLGSRDDPDALKPDHPALRELQRRLPGLRLTRTGALFEALLPAVVEQKVTGGEARRAYRRLVLRYGERAPGPLPLRVAPEPGVLARLPYEAFHPLGLERRRADVIRRAAAVAGRLQEGFELGPDETDRRLRTIRGIGPWTSAETRRIALGDPDAVSVGDYHLPHLVGWVLAGEPRGDDARMLELLEPYRGQRARVVRLLELSGQWPPAFGPHLAERRIERL